VKVVLDASTLILYFYGNNKAKEIIEKNMNETFVNSPTSHRPGRVEGSHPEGSSFPSSIRLSFEGQLG